MKAGATLIGHSAGPVRPPLSGTFIINNQAGAGGTVGATAAKRSLADGYTILVASLGPLVIGPHLIRGVAHATKDFDYATVAVQSPTC